jgi:hypothetical protein
MKSPAASSDTQCMWIECLHQLSWSNSGAAARTEICNSCNYVCIFVAETSIAVTLELRDCNEVLQSWTHAIIVCTYLLHYCCCCSACAYLESPCHSTIVESWELISACSGDLRMLWAVAASAGTKGMWMDVFANWVSRIVKLLHILKDAIVATIYICSWNHYSCYFIAQIAMKCCKWTYSWHVCIATLLLLMQCMCLLWYAWYTLSQQYNSCNLRVDFHMLLLLAEVSTASSSSQRRTTNACEWMPSPTE